MEVTLGVVEVTLQTGHFTGTGVLEYVVMPPTRQWPSPVLKATDSVPVGIVHLSLVSPVEFSQFPLSSLQFNPVSRSEGVSAVWGWEECSVGMGGVGG